MKAFPKSVGKFVRSVKNFLDFVKFVQTFWNHLFIPFILITDSFFSSLNTPSRLSIIWFFSEVHQPGKIFLVHKNNAYLWFPVPVFLSFNSCFLVPKFLFFSINYCILVLFLRPTLHLPLEAVLEYEDGVLSTSRWSSS